MAEKKETKQRPLKKGDFVRIAMEVMMKQHEPKTKEELQELKALEKEVEGLETQLTALVGGYIIQSDLLQKHTSMALLMAACISTCDILFMVEQLGDMKGITPLDAFNELLPVYKPMQDAVLVQRMAKAAEEAKQSRKKKKPAVRATVNTAKKATLKVEKPKK